MTGKEIDARKFYTRILSWSAIVVFSILIATLIELAFLRQVFARSQTRTLNKNESCEKRLISTYRDKNGVTHQLIIDLGFDDLGDVLDEHDGLLQGIMRRYPKEE